ncbi:MAG: hypothetical protein LBH79_02545 [Nitrososphaerota archaeon]|nr:hypothetical protein [Nitrososphaerota archaeon]
MIDIDPLEIYDSAYADWQAVDKINGTTHLESFLKKFGTREEFAAKTADKKIPESEADQAAEMFVKSITDTKTPKPEYTKPTDLTLEIPPEATNQDKIPLIETKIETEIETEPMRVTSP